MLESLRLDSAGVRELLKGPDLHAVINDLAAGVAAHVRAQVPAGTVVEERSYTTDRGAATVAVQDVRAMAWQARDGLLTRAAGASGLEVKAWQR